MKIAIVAALLPVLCAAANSDCSPCHAKIAETYARTGMGRSFSQTTFGPPLADFYHKASGTHFSMLTRDGKYYQRRWQIDSSGQPTHIDEKQIDYVMGSGNHVKTFLHRTAAGALQELPLAWYSENGGHWDMNPGYDTPIQPNSRRKIDYECMFCHNAYPKIPPNYEQLRAEPIFTEIPQGIDCQRCHGSGERHIELAKSPRPSATAIRAAIVNPSRLPSDRQMEVCAQCHLESDSFPFPHSILKYDRSQFSYKPGEPLSGFMLFFDHAPSATSNDRFQIVNSVYRLRMSACFTKSAGRFQCTTCHDPHNSNPPPQSGKASYNAICGQCHGAEFAAEVASKRHTTSTDCIACHMPKRRTDDVVHTVMTDHYIQRRKPSRDLLATIAEPHGPDIIYRGEVVRHDLSAAPTPSPDDELYLALAQVREENNLQGGIAQFSALLQKYRPKQAEFYVELADAFVKAGQPERSIPLYKEALQRNPALLAAELGLGGAAQKAGDLAQARDAYLRATQLAPQDAGSWRQLGETRIKLNQRAEASAALRKSLELEPELPETHYALASLTGDESSYKEAIRLQPDYSAAHMNLAILLFRRNQPDQAREHFESALRYHPDYALGHYNLGLMLASQNRIADALLELELSINPGSTPTSVLDSKTREAAIRRIADLKNQR